MPAAPRRAASRSSRPTTAAPTTAPAPHGIVPDRATTVTCAAQSLAKAGSWHQALTFADGSVAARADALAPWRPLRAPQRGRQPSEAAAFAEQQNRLARWPQPPGSFS